MEIVLASNSPRRRRLLKRIAGKFEVVPADCSEKLVAGESFAKAAVRLAEKKARVVARRHPKAIVVGADTIAYIGRKVCRKTDDVEAARGILRSLSGKTHTVVTGVCVAYPDGKLVKYSVKATVRMKRLEGKLLECYLRTGEWKGRTGCYDVSGKGRRLVAAVKGEKETVVGLPLRKLRRIILLRKDG